MEAQIGDDALLQNKKKKSANTLQTGHKTGKVYGAVTQQAQSSNADANVNTSTVDTLNIRNGDNPLVTIVLSLLLGCSLLCALIGYVLPAPKWIERRFNEMNNN